MFYIFYRFLFHLCKVLKFELWHSSYNYGDAEIMVLLMLQSHFFVYSGGYHLHVRISLGTDKSATFCL